LGENTHELLLERLVREEHLEDLLRPAKARIRTNFARRCAEQQKGLRDE